MSKVQGTTRGANGSSAQVVSLADRRAAGAEAGARRALDQLEREASAALEAVRAGDVDAWHTIFWAGGQAVAIVLRHRLATAWTARRTGA